MTYNQEKCKRFSPPAAYITIYTWNNRYSVKINAQVYAFLNRQGLNS